MDYGKPITLTLEAGDYFLDSVDSWPTRYIARVPRLIGNGSSCGIWGYKRNECRSTGIGQTSCMLNELSETVGECWAAGFASSTKQSWNDCVVEKDFSVSIGATTYSPVM